MGETSGKRRRRWSTALVVVVISGGTLAVAKRGGAGQNRLDPSLIVSARRIDLAVEILDTGKVRPRERVEIKSKVAGQVRRVFVEAGDRVKKGQPLLELDPTDYARDVAKCAADVAAARNALDFAELSLARRRRGLEARGVAEMDVDSAVSDVRARRVALRLATVAYRAASDRLHYTRIVAPMDGTVTERGIEPGEVVSPGVQASFDGKSLLTVADLSTLVVTVDLNQIDVARIRGDQKVTVTLDALPGRSYDALITRIAPASIAQKDKQVDVFPVEATLRTSDPAIKPGMTADVRIHIERKPGTLTVPIDAVSDEGGARWVERVVPAANGAARTERVEVHTGVHNDRDVEITGGLSERDQLLLRSKTEPHP